MNFIFDWAVLLTLRLRQKLVRILQRFLYPELQPKDTLKTIVVFRTGRLGDFLTAVPALHVLRSRLPHSRIVLVATVSSLPSMQTKTGAYADLASLPWLEFVAPSIANRAISLEMSDKSRGIDAMRSLLREENPDAIFVLPYQGESIVSKLKKLVYFRMAGHRRPIFGFSGFAARKSMRRTQFRLGIYRNEVFGPIEAISECALIGSVQENELVQTISIPDHDLQWATERLQKFVNSDGPLIAIGPGASFDHKTWPIDRFISICDQLRDRLRSRFVIIGAKMDRQLGAMLKRNFEESCLDLTGDTSVTQMAAILSQCQLFVGNDSGPVHVASAVGCPCVTVTSALDFPGIWEPWNSPEGVIRARIECEYCLSLTCCPKKTNACIQAIEPSEVLCRSLRLLNSDVQAAGLLHDIRGRQR